jgi:hypothetical protein
VEQPNKNTKLIYERHDGIVYSREFGADPSTRKVVDWDYDTRTSDGRPLHDHIMEDKMWAEIRRLARTNATLQAEVERVVATYHLIKDNG